MLSVWQVEALSTLASGGGGGLANSNDNKTAGPSSCFLFVRPVVSTLEQKLGENSINRLVVVNLYCFLVYYTRDERLFAVYVLVYVSSKLYSLSDVRINVQREPHTQSSKWTTTYKFNKEDKKRLESLQYSKIQNGIPLLFLF
jgi:hypothetical protein